MLLDRLLSSTNSRMHKAYPEMLSYLLKKPSYYASHSFVSFNIHEMFQMCGAAVGHFSRGDPLQINLLITPTPLAGTDGHQLNKVIDYTYRDTSLISMPWYFFVAACEAKTEAATNTLPWREYGTKRHPHYTLGKLVKSQTMSCNF